VRQQLTSSVAVYGKLGRSFRVATVDEVYNQFGGPLFDPIISFAEPQTSRDREVGVELRGDQVDLRTSLYYMSIENEIHFDPFTFTNINLPPTRRYGAEVEGHWRVNSWLEFAANYTYAMAEFRSGQLGGVEVAGNTVPLVPEHKLNIGVHINILPQTLLSAVLGHVGTQYFDGDETNTFGRKIPAYRTLDLRLAHKVGNWTAAATLTNAFSEEYFNYGLVTGTTFIAYPQPKSAVLFSLEYRVD
jgi:iron complex outermembrane receptor protein